MCVTFNTSIANCVDSAEYCTVLVDGGIGRGCFGTGRFRLDKASVWKVHNIL